MKEIYSFLAQLSQNNSREWFNANRQGYLAVREKFEAFAEKLIAEISEFDPDIAASCLQVKDCTYRIYRDTRFSKNKMPYKTHMGIFICRGGKKSPYAGYYLHLEPTAGFIHELSGAVPGELSGAMSGEHCQAASGDASQEQVGHNAVPLSMGGSFIIAGTYHYETRFLRSIRDEISVNGDSFMQSIPQEEGFRIDESDMLRKVPAEFASAPEKWHRLLRCRNYALIKPVNMEYICSGGALERIVHDFRECSTFINKINMAIDYANGNM